MEVVNTENQLIRKLRTINPLYVDVFVHLQRKGETGKLEPLRKDEIEQKRENAFK
jgi:hypothetical protein